jgi:membrane protein
MRSRATSSKVALDGSTAGQASIGIAETVLKKAKDHDVAGLAAELAYRSALTVLPFLLMLAALPSVAGSIFGIDDVGDRLIREAEALLSENSAEMMRTLIGAVAQSHGWTPFLVGILGTVMAGTLTTGSLRKALNRIYGFDDDLPFLRRKLIDLGLSIVCGIMFFVAIMALLIGPKLMGGENAITGVVAMLVALSLVMAGVSLLFWLAPSGDNLYRWVTPGALLFGVGWMLFSLGFSAYLSRFGLLNHVYGSLGAMIALLMWLYGSNLAVLLGAEVNAVVAQEKDPNVQRETVTPIR